MARKKAKNRVPKDVAKFVKERSEGRCEAMNRSTCTGFGEHLHHRQLRSQGGKHTIPNLVDVCAPCHSWFHREVAEAVTQGWIVRSTHDPATTPMNYRGRQAILSEGGGVEHLHIIT